MKLREILSFVPREKLVKSGLEYKVDKQVDMYMALISAILILVYKKENNLSGYKIPKLKMALELESLLMKEIVIL